MSGRNRGPPQHLMREPPQHHMREPPPHHLREPQQHLLREPPYGRSLAPMSHHALLEEMRERDAQQFGRGGGGGGPRGPLPPHPAFIEESLAAQHQEIQGLLVDNQRLAATHVALKQELEASQHELQRMAHIAGSMTAEKDGQLREVYEKSLKMEADIHAVEAMKAELQQVRGDIQKLSAGRQELMGQVQGLTHELNRSNADLHQAPALKAEIENMRQELQRARTAIENEQKGQAENYEQGQAMEKNLVMMAREMEKLRSEVANAESRARAAAAIGNSSAGYNGNYGNAETGYGGSAYPAGYGVNPVQGAGEAAAQYGHGPVPVPGAWGAYDAQRAHGRR